MQRIQRLHFIEFQRISIREKKLIIAIKGKDPPMTDKSSVCSEHILERYLKSELLGLPDPQKLKTAFPSMIKQFEKPGNLLRVIEYRK